MLRVLHIEPEDGEAERVAEALSTGFTVVRVSDAEAATLRLGRESYDAVLARLAVGDPDGLGGFARLQASARGIPVVVIVTRTNEALGLKAVQLGAQDCLVDEQLHPTLLMRCLRYAIESRRLRSELERRPAWGETPDGTLTVAARLYGAVPLRESVPGEFGRLVDAYGAALDMALEQRMYQVEHPVGDRLREIADRLGFLRGGARDVVDVHAATLRARGDTGSPRFRAIADESRLLLLELMGHVVTYYRRYSLGEAGPAIRMRTGEASPENGEADDG